MPEIIQTLQNGLILRRSEPADAEKLAEFNSRIHGDNPEDGARVAAWTRDLLNGKHPIFAPDDFTIVEESQSGKIVSSMNLISQTWAYAGIPFKVGRPELVGTDPEYRNRGLVRLQFDMIHRWSQERGELVQVITGIPYYYRLFGYEMTVNLGGGRLGYTPHVPKLEEGKEEPFRIRPAVSEDLPFIAEVYHYSCKRSLLATQWNPELWQYELTGKSPDNVNRYELRIIETPQAEPVGFLAHPFCLWGPTLACLFYELKAGASWIAVTPSVIRYLWKTGQEYGKTEGKEHSAYMFHVGESHPVYEAVPGALARTRPPYAWYIRVPDLPNFLRLITPVLEQRLAMSFAPGFSGEITIGFYRDGLKLIFEAGKFSVESWRPEPQNYGKAAFPGLTFLQLLFGYRSLAEIHYAFPDSYSSDDSKPILNALFPRQPSDLWPVS